MLSLPAIFQSSYFSPQKRLLLHSVLCLSSRWNLEVIISESKLFEWNMIYDLYDSTVNELNFLMVSLIFFFFLCLFLILMLILCLEDFFFWNYLWEWEARKKICFWMNELLLVQMNVMVVNIKVWWRIHLKEIYS